MIDPKLVSPSISSRFLFISPGRRRRQQQCVFDEMPKVAAAAAVSIEERTNDIEFHFLRAERERNSPNRSGNVGQSDPTRMISFSFRKLSSRFHSL